MEVAAHNVPNPFQAGKVKAVQCSQPQLPQAAVEMPVQYPAGSPADQGDVHCHHEAHKGCVAALIDGSDQVLIGFFPKALQRSDLLPVTVKVIQILIILPLFFFLLSVNLWTACAALLSETEKGRI